MEKFKKFCKKPLAITSICVIVACLLGIIIMSSIPYTESTYEYSLGSLVSIEIKVDDDEITITSTALGTTTVVEYDCMIKNGKLLVQEDPRSDTYIEYGKIDAYKLVLKEAIDESDPSQGYTYITLECSLTNNLRTFNIVMIVIGALGLTGSLAYIAYDKKKTVTSSTQATQNTQQTNG